MTVGADQMATLRAYLSGDYKLYQRLLDELDREKARTGLTALVAAAFYDAVYEGFVQNAISVDVIDFVADLRTRNAQAREVLDPQVAERMIRHALGQGSIADIDSDTKALHQITLVGAIIADRQLDEDGLDTFMSEARTIADDWIRKDAEEERSRGSDG